MLHSKTGLFYNIWLCTYNIEYKDGAKKGPEKVAGRYVGNAVFIEYPGSLHLALTNKHILKCAAEIEDIKGYMPGENIDGIESFTSASSLKIKWGSHKYSRLQRNVRQSGDDFEK